MIEILESNGTFQPNHTKENIQELEKKLNGLPDICNLYKMYYNYHYSSNRFRLLSKKFRKAIVESEIANNA